MRSNWSARCAVGLIGLGLVVTTAGCTSGDGKPDPTESLVMVTPDAEDLEGSTPAAAVGTVDSDLGKIAVDLHGYTLYRYEKDSSDPSNSACEGKCAERWKPLLSEDAMPVALPGITPSDLGVFTREDGSTQVTLSGWPLYRFSGDEKAGQTTGHQADGEWRAAASDGSAAGDEKEQKGSSKKSGKDKADQDS